jgi:AbiU2
MNAARESFDIIQRMVTTAKASWAIWFQLYCNFEHGGPYAVSAQIFYPFWNAIYHSQIHYVFVILNDLFGKRRNVHSFTHLMALCRPGLHPYQYAECETLMASVRRYQKGVGILRGKHFGHKLVDAPLADVLKEAGLKIKDVDKLLKVASDLVANLMCAFVGQFDSSYHVDFDSDESAKETVVEILQSQLDKFNELGKPKPEAQ